MQSSSFFLVATAFSGVSTLSMLKAGHIKAPGSSSYSVVINVIQRTTLGGFLLGAIYAGSLLWSR